MRKLVIATAAIAAAIGIAVFVYYRSPVPAQETETAAQPPVQGKNLDAIAQADRRLVTYEPGPDSWDEANAKVRRLSTEAYPELPAAVKNELSKRQCTVPQTFISTQPHNVIHGEFLRKGQQDWAVLCSTGQASSILVFWGGSAKDVLAFPSSSDRDYLQGIGDGVIGYSCEISAAGKDHILEHYKQHGGPVPPPITHDGIEVAFVEKASSVLYLEKGEWLHLTGAD